jgi:hypothetical protein
MKITPLYAETDGFFHHLTSPWPADRFSSMNAGVLDFALFVCWQLAIATSMPFRC